MVRILFFGHVFLFSVFRLHACTISSNLRHKNFCEKYQKRLTRNTLYNLPGAAPERVSSRLSLADIARGCNRSLFFLSHLTTYTVFSKSLRTGKGVTRDVNKIHKNRFALFS